MRAFDIDELVVKEDDRGELYGVLRPQRWERIRNLQVGDLVAYVNAHGDVTECEITGWRNHAAFVDVRWGRSLGLAPKNWRRRRSWASALDHVASLDGHQRDEAIDDLFKRFIQPEIAQEPWSGESLDDGPF